MRKGRAWTAEEKLQMRAKMLKKNGKTLVPVDDVLLPREEKDTVLELIVLIFKDGTIRGIRP